MKSPNNEYLCRKARREQFETLCTLIKDIGRADDLNEAKKRISDSLEKLTFLLKNESKPSVEDFQYEDSKPLSELLPSFVEVFVVILGLQGLITKEFTEKDVVELAKLQNKLYSFFFLPFQREFSRIHTAEDFCQVFKKITISEEIQELFLEYYVTSEDLNASILKDAEDLQYILRSLTQAPRLQEKIFCHVFFDHPGKFSFLIETNGSTGFNQLLDFLLVYSALSENTELQHQLVYFFINTSQHLIQTKEDFNHLILLLKHTKAGKILLNFYAETKQFTIFEIKEWKDLLMTSDFYKTTNRKNELSVIESFVNQPFTHEEGEWLAATKRLIVGSHGDHKIEDKSLLQLFNLLSSDLFFRKISGKKAVSEILSVALNPNVIDQGNKNLCGMAVTLQYFALTPNKFIHFMVKLALCGKTGYPFKIKANLKDCDEETSLISAVLSAMKNTSNFAGYSLFGFSFSNEKKRDPLEPFWGSTLPKDICSLIRQYNADMPTKIEEESMRVCLKDGSETPLPIRFALGGFYSKYHHHEKDSIREINALIQGVENDHFCAALISSQLKASLSDGLISKEILENKLPAEVALWQISHYVRVLDAELIQDEDNSVGQVKLLISTYGSIYLLKLPLDVYETHIFGALVVQPPMEMEKDLALLRICR